MQGQTADKRTASSSTMTLESEEFILQVVASRTGDRASSNAMTDEELMEKAKSNASSEVGAFSSSHLNVDAGPKISRKSEVDVDEAVAKHQADDFSTQNQQSDADAVAEQREGGYRHGADAPEEMADLDILRVVQERAKLLDESSRSKTERSSDSEDPAQLQRRRGPPMRDESEPGAFTEAPMQSSHRRERLRFSLVGVAGEFTSSELIEEEVHQTHGVTTCHGPTCPEPTEDSSEVGTCQDDVVEARPVDQDEFILVGQAEPVDLEAQRAQEEMRKQRERKCQMLGLLCVISVITVAVVFIMTQLGGREEAEQSAKAPTLPTLQPNAPSAAPSLAVSEAEVMLGHLEDYTLESLKDPLSPQYESFEWLKTHTNISTMEVWRKRQLLALGCFYFAFDGPNWPHGLNKDWLDDTKSECEWFSSLFGGFPEEIGKYVQLDRLNEHESCNQHGEFSYMVCIDNAGSNNFIQYGTRMPPEISMLTSMQRMTVLGHRNFHNMSVPDLIPPQLVQLPKLETLDLSGNGLSGSIPTYFGLTTSLKFLSISGNPLSGSVPSQLGLITSLVHLHLANTSLTGTIPQQVASLVGFNLSNLNLQGSDSLSGTIPAELCSLETVPCNRSPQLDESCALAFECGSRLCGCSCDCPGG